MARKRKYTDEQLVAAISAATSWRGVLRELGLTATSSGAMRSVRSHADDLGLEYNHFRSQRRWTERDLRAAIARGSTWAGVGEILRLKGGSEIESLKGHAARLGLETVHLTPSPPAPYSVSLEPDITHLDRAGSLLAAAWYTLSGQNVSWPLEPSRFDLLVCTEAGTRRVQVKTTKSRAGHSWKVYLSTCRRSRRTYTPAEIDDFFILDGDLNAYLIPVAAVGGLHAIHLAAYSQYRLPRIPRI